MVFLLEDMDAEMLKSCLEIDIPFLYEVIQWKEIQKQKRNERVTLTSFLAPGQKAGKLSRNNWSKIEM